MATVTLNPPVSTEAISETYDGSKLFIKLLRGSNWGPEMLNLGYYKWYNRPPFLSINNAQRTLAYKLISLLEVRNGDTVVDIACGRGGTTDLLSGTTEAGLIYGLDLLPENIAVAKSIFSPSARLKYMVGDAQDIPFDDGTFDRAMCCEAAFHFPDRAKFISEIARVLKPGGRFATCDFVWKSEDSRTQAHQDDRGAVVRRIWQYEDMATEAEYREWCQDSGLRFVSATDWTKPVTKSLQRLAEMVVQANKQKLKRRLLFRRRPHFRLFTPEDWAQLEHEVQSHRFVTDLTQYKAFVIEKAD